MRHIAYLFASSPFRIGLVDAKAHSGLPRITRSETMKRPVLRIWDVANYKGKKGRIPVHSNTILRWVREKKFPAPFKIGCITVWDADEVDAFISQQMAATMSTKVKK